MEHSVSDRIEVKHLPFFFLVRVSRIYYMGSCVFTIYRLLALRWTDRRQTVNPEKSSSGDYIVLCYVTFLMECLPKPLTKILKSLIVLLNFFSLFTVLRRHLLYTNKPNSVHSFLTSLWPDHKLSYLDFSTLVWFPHVISSLLSQTLRRYAIQTLFIPFPDFQKTLSDGVSFSFSLSDRITFTPLRFSLVLLFYPVHITDRIDSIELPHIKYVRECDYFDDKGYDINALPLPILRSLSTPF